MHRLGGIISFHFIPCHLILFPTQLPIGAEDTFQGVVDLVHMRAIVWNGEELGASFQYVDIPDDLKALADEYRATLVEAAVELVSGGSSEGQDIKIVE